MIVEVIHTGRASLDRGRGEEPKRVMLGLGCRVR